MNDSGIGAPEVFLVVFVVALAVAFALMINPPNKWLERSRSKDGTKRDEDGRKD